MKKIISFVLAFSMIFGCISTAFASQKVDSDNAAIEIGAENTALTPYAFPERPSGRTWEDEYTSREGYENMRDLLNIISALLPNRFASAATGVASAIYAQLAERTELTYFVSLVEEYYVYDFEGEINAYKYYVTVNVYSDSRHKNLIASGEEVRQSTSPMKNEDVIETVLGDKY